MESKEPTKPLQPKGKAGIYTDKGETIIAPKEDPITPEQLEEMQKMGADFEVEYLPDGSTKFTPVIHSIVLPERKKKKG
jgi:hypothetical protein